jgi:hypothetical protein
VALPFLHPARTWTVWRALETAGILERHDCEYVELGPAEHALRASPVELRTMGRDFAVDPDPFRAGAAAGVLAAKSLAIRI